MRRLASVALVLAAAGAAMVALDANAGRFTSTGTVTSVIDGDTIQVALKNGKSERVRLIGINAPERGACFSSQATALARSLAQGKSVVLRGDPTQDTRDRYGRLLAYAWLAGGKDLGQQLVARGAAKVYVYDSAFSRLGAYRSAERSGRRIRPSVWSCGVRKETKPAAKCHPAYPTICLDPNASDYDCAGGSGNGPKYVDETNFRVLPPDPFGLDGNDNDGIGCED